MHLASSGIIAGRLAGRRPAGATRCAAPKALCSGRVSRAQYYHVAGGRNVLGIFKQSECFARPSRRGGACARRVAACQTLAPVCAALRPAQQQHSERQCALRESIGAQPLKSRADTHLNLAEREEEGEGGGGANFPPANENIVRTQPDKQANWCCCRVAIASGRAAAAAGRPTDALILRALAYIARPSSVPILMRRPKRLICPFGGDAT